MFLCCQYWVYCFVQWNQETQTPIGHILDLKMKHLSVFFQLSYKKNHLEMTDKILPAIATNQK